jgi:hypothetical protein
LIKDYFSLDKKVAILVQSFRGFGAKSPLSSTVRSRRNFAPPMKKRNSQQPAKT